MMSRNCPVLIPMLMKYAPLLPHQLFVLATSELLWDLCLKTDELVKKAVFLSQRLHVLISAQAQCCGYRFGRMISASSPCFLFPDSGLQEGSRQHHSGSS